MNNRICNARFRKLYAFCFASMCLAATGCKDDYKFDDEDPSFLGQSIYEELKTRGTYTNFVKIIDDLGYAEVLGKTGSKTLFVADDDAFAKFYQSNSWGVKDYASLSLAQKKLLLNSAMINNAYLLEMMSSTEGPIKGECLRRETAADVTDSITFLTAAELPTSYNLDDKDYWAPFRDESKGGIFIAMDGTNPMMTHFLPGQMSQNGITDGDFQIIVGTERDKNDAFIYDSKVLEQDITCQNGYINRLDKVLLTPSNMAELLRTNGRTNIFSHMIDRFSAPFYSQELTDRYRLLHEGSEDSVYQKRYFSLQEGFALNNDKGTDPKNNPTGNAVKYGLNFDPGWNQYRTDNQTAKERDMGVIFAPTDEVLYNYFFNGGGKFLIDAYAPEQQKNVNGPTDYANIYNTIDQIPLTVIQALTNNLMKLSFNNSVPSKFETIKDDAQDPMLDETHIDKIEDVKLANNGAVYIMDEVLTPAKYAAVSAPAYVAQDMKIFNYAVNEKTLDIDCNFYAYLLAMSARFSFFVPQDTAFWYIDPVSFALEKGKQRAFLFEWSEKNGAPTCTPYQYDYDFTTGEGTIGNKLASVSISATEWKNRLRDMLETHTIVHSDDSLINHLNESKTGIECNKHYFISKNGAPIYVSNATGRAGSNPCMVQGGWQIDHNDACKVIRFDDKTRETNGNGNGYAYEIDKPMTPTIESVYSVMYNDKDNFGEFFDLCQTDVEVLSAVGITSTAEQKRYTVFISNNGLPAYDKADGSQVATATNVKYFNNYRYTVWVPTNDAILEAISKGLPTWQQIRDLLYLDVDPEDRPEWTEEEEDAIKTKGLAMVTCLVNFIKNHFQDNSVFVDLPYMEPTKYETQTLQLDEEGNPSIYAKVTVSSDEGQNTLYVTDALGHKRNVTNAHNIITRDYVLNSASSPTKIDASSSAVVHGIDGVLDYKSYSGNRYDSDWKTASACRKYLKKYRIVE